MDNQMNEEFEIKDQVLVRYKGEEHFVDLPEGLAAIGEGAFRDCRSLWEVTIPAGVTEIRHGDGKKGIVALVQGKKPGGVLGIRADYDALHMTEETGLPFAATNGNMHACGHDAHAAILLGTANLLLDCADELAGTVKLIFQPPRRTARARSR